MFHRVKRYAVLAAAVVVLLATAGLGTASAATAAVRAPRPHCNLTELGPNKGCTCPSGWQVRFPPWWDFWRSPTCIRKR